MEVTAASQSLENVEVRVQHMDQLGIDVQVVYPTIFIEQVTDKPEIDVALMQQRRALRRHIVADGEQLPIGFEAVHQGLSVEIRDGAEAKAAEAPVPESLADDVRAMLDEYPTMSWDAAVARLLPDKMGTSDAPNKN